MYKQMDSLIAFIKGDKMILAMPGEIVKICSYNPEDTHSQIMNMQLESTEDAFLSALDKTSDTIMKSTVFLLHKSLTL